MEINKSYSQEFDEALERELTNVEKTGNKILCTILFGGLSNNSPKIERETGVLKSDADILVVVKNEERAELNSRKIKFSHLGKLGGKRVTKFSERIPDAEIIVQSETALEEGMDYLDEQCAKADKYDYIPLQLEDTAIFQALDSGVVLRGELSGRVKKRMKMTEKKLSKCKNRTNTHSMGFEF